MSIKYFTINTIDMYDRYGDSITSGLPYEIKINATMVAQDIWNTGLQVYLQTRIIDKNNNTILIKSGGDITHANGNKSGYYTLGTDISYTANVDGNPFTGDDRFTANFTIENFEKSVLEGISEGYDFTNSDDIKDYIEDLNDRIYSHFSFDIRAYNNSSVTRVGEGKIHIIPSNVSIYVPTTPTQFTAPEELRIAIKNSLNLSASNNSSNLIYSPVMSNYAIINYKQRTDCLVGTCLERNDGTNIKIAWKNNSRIIFSKTFYDYLTILRRPGATIDIDGKSYYIPHPFPLTKLEISLTCVKGTSKDYKKTFTIDQTELIWDSTNENYYYSLTNSTVFDYTANNDDENYLMKQGQTLNFEVDIDLLDVNEKPDTWASYWGSGTLNLVITNPDVPSEIKYYGDIKSELTLSKESSDNNILYCDQKANSYTINIPATETNERYIIYNYKISFCLKHNKKKIELWRGYGLPDSINTSSLPTDMQSSNNNNKIKSNNLFSVTFTKEVLNSKILTALGSQKYYNGLRGDELWEGYFIVESVLGDDYDIIDKDTDIKITTSKQIGDLLLSNNLTKIDESTLKLTVTKHKLVNNKKEQTEVEYEFNWSGENIKDAKEKEVGYVNNGEEAIFKQFGFYHYRDVKYTSLKLIIQNLGYDDALSSRIEEIDFGKDSDFIRGLNNNTQTTTLNNLTFSRYLYNINQPYLSDSNYNSSFYSLIAGSIFTVQTTFTYKDKEYSETHSTKRYRKIVFCNVDRNRFNSIVELKQYIAKNDSKNSIEVSFSEDFLDIGGALSYNQDQPYNSWYQHFYFDGNDGRIEREITAYYKENDTWKNLKIGNDGADALIKNVFEFDDIMTTIPSAPKTHTITIYKDTLEKIFGEVKILITYSLNDGAYYSDFSVGSTISNNLRIKTREIYFNTASPTVYKRPFSVGINQLPGDEEVLRIDIPEMNQNKKYISLGDNLLIDLSDGSFYIYTGSSATEPEAGTIYLTATIPEQDYNTDETEIKINNSVPFREKVGIPEKHKKIYKKYSKKTSF